MVTGQEILRISSGERLPTYIVAELSANHHHRLERAEELVHAAKQAGADAIKLQTYTPDTMTIECDREFFQIGEGTIWEGQNLYELYEQAYTPWEWHPRLFELARELGMDCFSTPFDETSVDYLESLDVPCYKIASFEVVVLPLLRKVAATGRPVIMSTGMARLSEIEEAVTTLREAGTQDLILLKCTSAYPSPAAEMNLNTIPHLAAAFDVPVGLSDHTLGIAVPIVAVSLGACMVEKHFTLSREDPGPDSAFSLEPHEFKAMVDAVRITEESKGEVSYEPTDREQASRVFRRSLFVVAEIPAGEELTDKNIRCIRPGHGLAPKYLPTVLGRHAVRDLARGKPLDWDDVQ